MIVVGPESALAAEAAECAGTQGQFFPYHDLLFLNQGRENAGNLNVERLGGYAGQLGLDQEAFTTCLESGTYRGTVLQSTRDGVAVGVRSTPTVFVNGRLVQNPMDLDEIRDIIFDELERGS